MKMKTWSAIGILVLSVFLYISSSYAASSSSDDDYNFSWLDPDKKIYVLQNRRYRKTGNPDIFIMGGISLGDTYRNVYMVQPRFGVWFTEELGIEAFYADRFNSVNNAYKALSQAINTNGVTSSPYIREITSEFGILFNWAPWYAKINVFNSILYFDWYFSFGLGELGTQAGPETIQTQPASWTTENLFAVYAGTGQMFHLSEHWKVRLDFLGHFYSAPIYVNSGDKAVFSNFDFSLGIGYKL
jgi:outer membrane beta-barrel protein